jgi:hypothetical protein
MRKFGSADLNPNDYMNCMPFPSPHKQEFRNLSYARIAELRSAVRLRVVQSIEESNKRRYGCGACCVELV